MATINQLRIERLAYYRELKRGLRGVDTQVEDMKRQVDRILSRRRNVPEVADFQTSTRNLKQILDALVQLEKILETGRAIFQILNL